MLKNIKWLLFGGIAYRLRGFMIGLVAGFALASFAPSAVSHIKEYLSWVVPTAHAAPYYDYNAVGTDSDLNSGSIPFVQIPNSNDNLYMGQRVQAFSSGDLTHIQARLQYDAGIDTANQYRFHIYSDSSNALGSSLGLSAYYDVDDLPDYDVANTNDCTPANMYCPISTYSLYPDSLGSLTFSSGEFYWVLVEFLNPWGAGPAQINWASNISVTPTLRRVLCDSLSPLVGCSYATNGNRFALTTIFDDGSPYDILGLFGVGYGPHISLDPDTYDLSYYCNHAGDIWGYDASVGGSYSDLGVSCISGDTGFLTLDLSGSLSEWSFQLMFDGIPIADSAATIYYNPNNAPILPPDGGEAVDVGFCLDFLISDEEAIEPELNVDEEISEGFLAWGKGVALAAFSSIYGTLAHIPVIGDYMTVNCMMYDSFISNLDPDSELVFSLNFDGFMGMDETDEIEVDLTGVADDFVVSGQDNPRYDGFRLTMTLLFVFVLFWKFWHLFHPSPPSAEEEHEFYVRDHQRLKSEAQRKREHDYYSKNHKR